MLNAAENRQRDQFAAGRGVKVDHGRTPRKVDPHRFETYRGQDPRYQVEADRDGLED